MKRMQPIAQAVIVGLVILTGASSATADWHDFWHNLHVGYFRNNAWPDPFNEVDANSVVRPFDIMKSNGWRMHNTIGNEMFRGGDSALLAAGTNKVHWIATQAPTSRRTIFVLRGRNQAETDARLAAVNESLGNMVIIGQRPAVAVTDIEPSTASGDWATKIQRDRLAEMPAPRLPSTSSSGSSGATQ